MHNRGRRVAWAIVAFSAITALGLGAETSAQASNTAQIEGTVLRVADAPQNAAMVRQADGTLRRIHGTAAANLNSGDTVRATVSATSSGLTAAAAAASTPSAAVISINAVRKAAAPRGKYTPGVHPVTVVIGTPAGVKGAVATPAQIRNQVSLAAKFWMEQTSNTVRFSTAAIVGPVKMKAGCGDYSALWNEAANVSKFTQQPNAHLVVVVPENAYDAGCSYGLGTVGVNVNSGGVVYVADTAWPVLAHELGHNLGLNHAAGFTKCGVADVRIARSSNSVAAANASCELDAYGDPWDVMAASSLRNAGSLSSAQAMQAGFLDATTVPTVTSGTLTTSLNSISVLKGRRGVKAVDPVTKETYFIEYRTRTGRDSVLYANMTPGVRVLRYVGSSPSWPATVALDATPTNSSADMSRQIPVGRTFTSYTGGVKVTVKSTHGTVAVVTVTVATPAAKKR